jgi:hypothetical protein
MQSKLSEKPPTSPGSCGLFLVFEAFLLLCRYCAESNVTHVQMQYLKPYLVDDKELLSYNAAFGLVFR